tara:strand:+ start:271 stop:603 length:333 start_codon:yes stop_codon:yes gene_type:complete
MSGLVDQSADARSKTIGQNFRVRAFANININGSGTTNQGFDSISRPGTGSYQLTFAKAPPNSNYVVVATAEASGGYNVSVHDKQTTGFKLSVTYENAGSYNAPCSVIVMY